jgi:SAM-dependent methyltransferase
MYNKKSYDYLESESFNVIYKYVADNIIGSILDVGCWSGMLYKQITNKNIEYLGFDLCKDAIKDAQNTYNNHIFIVNDICNIIDKHFDTIYFGGIFYYINDNEKLSFLQKYIEIVKPKRVIIQDLQITNFNMLNIYNPIINKLTINYGNLNIERLQRQIIIIDL